MTLIDYIESIIGFEYSENPVCFILCVFIVIWFIYQFWTFIYYLFGVHKR